MGVSFGLLKSLFLYSTRIASSWVFRQRSAALKACFCDIILLRANTHKNMNKQVFFAAP